MLRPDPGGVRQIQAAAGIRACHPWAAAIPEARQLASYGWDASGDARELRAHHHHKVAHFAAADRSRVRRLGGYAGR